MNTIDKVYRSLAGLLPQDCFICTLPAQDSLLCPGCLESLPTLPSARCPVCALPAPGGALCGACTTRQPHFDATLAAFEYRFPVEPLIIAFKYQARLPVAPFLASFIDRRLGPVEADCLIPMPLHPRRLAERGFNQSAEIARRLGKHWGLPVLLQAVVRERHTPPQAPLRGAERHQNVKNAFRCLQDFTGQHVMVVDDVMTTGSTLDEIARVLKARGAVRVTNCVVARTISREHPHV